jgi:hypothetical protein
MPPPRRIQPTTYNKPRRINVISVTLFLIFVGLAYFGYCTWPVLALRMRAKNEIEEMMTQFWKANLRGVEASKPDITRLRKELTAKIAAAGVHDKNLEVFFERASGRIAVEARFSTTAYFPGIDKTHVFQLAPRGETDAARVDW